MCVDTYNNTCSKITGIYTFQIMLESKGQNHNYSNVLINIHLIS